MPVSETFRTVVLVFLGTHIPATLMMDSQALLPPAIVPGFMKSLLDFHVRTNHDPLMAAPPAWFKSFILFELLFQLPFFFIGFNFFFFFWLTTPYFGRRYYCSSPSYRLLSLPS